MANEKVGRKISPAVLKSFSPLYRQVADQFIASGRWVLEDDEKKAEAN